jgi:adenylylsulfate kinase
MNNNNNNNNNNTSEHRASVTRARRALQNGHKSVIVWFTGLSGSGKSTLAHAVEEHLHQHGCRTFVLDGDNVRQGLCQDLGFSEAARTENIRRIGEVAKLCIEAGSVVLTAFISPFERDRARVRALVPEGDFLEVYCACPLEVCETRDVKGLYRRARQGEIANFTGISSPYEAPSTPDLCVDTARLSIEQSVASVLGLLQAHAIIE